MLDYPTGDIPFAVAPSHSKASELPDTESAIGFQSTQPESESDLRLPLGRLFAEKFVLIADIDDPHVL
jgi:hypothetical protein